MPSLNRDGIPAIPIINSSNRVERRPSGSSLGTGENNFPQAEYWGTLLESPPFSPEKVRALALLA